MLDEHQLAEGEQVADRCPHCGLDTALRVDSNHRLAPAWEKRLNLPPGMPFIAPLGDFQVLRVFSCSYCGQTTLVRLRFPAVVDATEMGRDAIEVEIVWPKRPPRELSTDVPDAVRALYREASICEVAGALRGAAGLLRACVEEIARDKQATGGNLKEEIDDLATKVPALSADVIRDLHDARLTGNWSLHDGVEFSAEEVEDVALLIEQAVQVIYVEPARRQALAQARATRRGGQTPP